MKRWLAGCLALVLALLSFGCGGQAQTDKAVEWGRADAKEIDVNSKVTGRVVELLVKEGAEVKAGQVIARIDNVGARAGAVGGEQGARRSRAR